MMANRKFKVISKCLSSSDPCLLTPEQVQFYKDNGYLVIKKLFDLPTLDSYRQRFVDVCNGRVDQESVTIMKNRALCKPGSKPEDYINKIQELNYDKVFSTYSEDPRLLHIVAQLIGEDLTLINLMLINKPPGTAVHPPHQDLLYFPFRPASKILGTWTAVDAVTKDNGCLFVIPGSHRPEELYQHSNQSCDATQFYYGLADSKSHAPEHRRVYLEMQPGDTVLFSSALIHGSLANTTQRYRKAMTCHYANSSCQYISVPGTWHEEIGRHIEKQLKRMGGELSFTDLVKIKTTQVRGVRCNL